MTTVIHMASPFRQEREPFRLPPARPRRLSTIARRHAPPSRGGSRDWVVQVTRPTTTAAEAENSFYLEREWKDVLVGPRDVVSFVRMPRGGSMGGGAGIAAALSIVALIAIPFLAPVIASGLGLAGTAFTIGSAAVSWASLVKVGLTVGVLALTMALQAKNKRKRDDPIYGVTGGGNIPRSGERLPAHYGRCWTTPPLSQQDVTEYVGDEMVLTKRMTLGVGLYDVEAIKVGDATFWTAAGGVQAPFNTVANAGAGGFVSGAPGVVASMTATAGAAVEILDGSAPSVLMPGDVISSPDVSGQEIPRAGGNPDWTPWFTATGPGVEVTELRWDYQWPQGIYKTGDKGQKSADGQVLFEYQQVDAQTGVPIGPLLSWTDLHYAVLRTKALRKTRKVEVPKGRYRCRARNVYPETEGWTNGATWDAFRGVIPDARVRPGVTEIVMRIVTGKGLAFTSFSDVTVLSTRKTRIWTGSAWTNPIAQRSAVWAAVDLLRDDAHGGQPDGAIDLPTFKAFADAVANDNTFDGPIDGSAPLWDEIATVLAPMRADIVNIGRRYSMVRDEPRLAPRAVISRRQIVKDSGGLELTLAAADGAGDVIVDFNRDGDPRQQDSVRATLPGLLSRTPKRITARGISSGEHAIRHARWLAAAEVYRTEKRTVTVAQFGAHLLPGDPVICDLWFHDPMVTAGVASRSGFQITLDADLDPADVPASPYLVLRRRDGFDFGPIAFTRAGRVLTLNNQDVTGAQSASGVAFSEVFAQDHQTPTTVVIGRLNELQVQYRVRSVQPQGMDRVQIEMVEDDARVWAAIGEPYLPPAPPSAPYGDPVIPVISAVYGRCVRVETGIGVEWSVTPARGAVAYRVELAYAGGTWEGISADANTSGLHIMRQSEGTVGLRAKAISAAGYEGPWATTTFETIPPRIDAGLIDAFTLKMIQFDAGVAAALAGSRELVALMDAEIAGGLLKVDTLRRTLEVKTDASNARFDELIKVGANERFALAERQTVFEASVGARFDSTGQQISGALARVTTEEQARAAADSALASLISTLQAQVAGFEANADLDVKAVANAAGALSTITLAAKASANGQASTAAIIIEALAPAGGGPPDSRITIKAANLRLVQEFGGVVVTPFAVDSLGRVIINSLRITSAISFDPAVIGAEALRANAATRSAEVIQTSGMSYAIAGAAMVVVNGMLNATAQNSFPLRLVVEPGDDCVDLEAEFKILTGSVTNRSVHIARNPSIQWDQSGIRWMRPTGSGTSGVIRSLQYNLRQEGNAFFLRWRDRPGPGTHDYYVAITEDLIFQSLVFLGTVNRR